VNSREGEITVELRQLQTLVAIADHGSFSAAAKALVTVQSNVSAHLARLEKQLGAQLVERATGNLTDEGELVVARARRILHELEDIDGDIHSLGQSPTGECRLGSIGTTARWLIPPMLLGLERTHPGVRVTLLEGATSSLLPRVIAGEIDAAIVHLPVAGAGLQVTQMFSEELLLIAPPGHPLAGRESVSLAELSEHPIIQPPPGTPQRRIVDRTAASAGVAMRSLAEIDGVRLMASLVFDGFGAAIVPASVVPAWLTGTFVRIAVPELPRRTVGWVQRERPRPNRATFAVRDMALDVISRHGPRQPGVTLSADGTAAGTAATSGGRTAARRPGNGGKPRV